MQRFEFSGVYSNREYFMLVDRRGDVWSHLRWSPSCGARPVGFRVVQSAQIDSECSTPLAHRDRVGVYNRLPALNMILNGLPDLLSKLPENPSHEDVRFDSLKHVWTNVPTTRVGQAQAASRVCGLLQSSPYQSSSIASSANIDLPSREPYRCRWKQSYACWSGTGLSH